MGDPSERNGALAITIGDRWAAQQPGHGPGVRLARRRGGPGRAQRQNSSVRMIRDRTLPPAVVAAAAGWLTRSAACWFWAAFGRARLPGGSSGAPDGVTGAARPGSPG